MHRIAIIEGSTRPGRRCPAVVDWIARAGQDDPAVVAGEIDLARIDLSAQGLPLLDEAVPALFGRYEHAHTRAWSDRIRRFDGFIFVTPEYNHSVPAALKNAIDFLYDEWADKAAAIVSYGVDGGVRAAEHLRPILAEVGVATVRHSVALSLFDDFTAQRDGPVRCEPRPRQREALARLFSDLGRWAGALAPLREEGRDNDVEEDASDEGDA